MILLSTTSLFLIKSISFFIYLSIWILSSNKEIQCQNTERVSRAHDSFKQKDKNLEYIVLDDEIYDEMILLFLCLGCKYNKLKHRYTDLKIYDIKFLLNKKFCIS